MLGETRSANSRLLDSSFDLADLPAITHPQTL
jgi:hypothetical protein